MKYTFFAALLAACALTLAACGEKKQDEQMPAPTEESAPAEQAPAEQAPAEPAPAEPAPAEPAPATPEAPK